MHSRKTNSLSIIKRWGLIDWMQKMNKQMRPTPPWRGWLCPLPWAMEPGAGTPVLATKVMLNDVFYSLKGSL